MMVDRTVILMIVCMAGIVSERKRRCLRQGEGWQSNVCVRLVSSSSLEQMLRKYCLFAILIAGIHKNAGDKESAGKIM